MIRRSNQSFMKRANHGLFLFFRPFLNTISIIPIEKSIGGVLEIRTRGRVMVGADDTTKLWRPPIAVVFLVNTRRY